MTKIGRNEPCPCMSGKKYKKCCENQKERDLFLKKELNAQYIDSKYMLDNFLKEPSPLINYLKDKLELVKKPIMWLLNPNLNANMRSMSLENLYAIIVKEVPVKEEDYFDVAHEIGHLILASEGYPTSSPIDGDFKKAYLCTILNNTILDPLINKEVKKYGFDFNSYINKGVKIQVPYIKSLPSENFLDLYNKHFIKCLMIEKLLEWDLLDKNIINPFEEICKQKYINLYKIILEEVEYIRNIGYDTPEKAKKILTKILNDNNMTDIIEII
ncbi:YecA family protein [Intestinibacter bartlettii]|uniref:Uncharacterized protein n=1 Tax=Intestinibacter bartlettii CAG:1329 TaxID=1263063 RepID=R5X8P5_9FIRM|nr:SEC-C metal-binding domain-containing protein [Intestinibacter bartlettii]CDA11185.1 putative uncharacterized protein GK3259 [Intestinibacter bartlettii CAG:1329]